MPRYLYLFIAAVTLATCVFLYEQPMEGTDYLYLERDGIVKVDRNVLRQLPRGYRIIPYKYTIRGCTLSTFHRDVTSSANVFGTKHAVYTYIVYHNTGPHLSFCPGSHKTTPYLFARPKTIFGRKGDSYLFDCDLVHAGALNTHGDKRHVDQYKIVHEDDLPKMTHLTGIDESKLGTCDINVFGERCLRDLSLLFAFPINHVFTPLLQTRATGWMSKLIERTGLDYYNT